MFISKSLHSQIVINEFLASNSSGIIDEDGERCDWIELYNNSENSINLDGYAINDAPVDSTGWVFPGITIEPGAYFLFFASGKDRREYGAKYKTVIRQGDEWSYYVPEALSSGWRETGFDDSSWQKGNSGFGYGDDDDETYINGVETICIRKEFEIDDVNAVTDLILHVDYDDGFVAFINGQLVASSYVTSLNDDYTSVEISSDHEANMYSGGDPEEFVIDDPASVLVNGTNVIAIQGHNVSSTSSDFSLIPFLTIGSNNYTVNDTEDFITITNKSLHTDFKISSEGESLYLFNAASELIDSTNAVSLPKDISYGRYEDGQNNWAYFSIPTPGTENLNPSGEIISDTVYFSQIAGLYSSAIELSLTASTTNGEIRYTTDGSEPTTESVLYTSPLQISSTAVIRAKFFRNDYQINPAFTNTYLMRSNNGLPVVSLSTEPENFWDYNTGILVEGPNAQLADPHYGANYWQDWEKVVNLELFDENANRQISQGAGVKVYGSWSRANPSKSLALYARSEYGEGSFNYKLFHDRDNDQFESFILRNAGNDWWYAYIRDGLISELAKDMDMERLAFQPASIYLNGEYWGMLNLREKPNEHYFVNNFGVDSDELNLIENESSVLRGSNQDYLQLKSYINSNSLQSDENYEYVLSKIDVDCFIDYNILQIYIYNTDWPGNNIKFWNTNDELSKWRWIIFGAEYSFSLYGSPSQTNTLEYVTDATQSSWPNPAWSTLFLRKLLTNSSFEDQFVTRMCDCFNTNLEPTYVNSLTDSIKTLIDAEMAYHLDLWDRNYNDWENHVQRIKTYVNTRSSNMFSYIKSFFGFNTTKNITITVSDTNAGSVKVNTVIPFDFPFEGKYFSEVPVTLSALPKTGYRFVRWEGGSTSTDRIIEFYLTTDQQYHAVFELSVETEKLVAINEINYKSSPEIDAGDWIELYNYGDQTINIGGWMLYDDIVENAYTFPDGILLAPGDYLVVCENISKFSAIYPHIENITGELSFGLSSDGDVIYLVDESGDIIDRVLYESKAPWPDEPFGSGATLELIDPSKDNEEASNWGYSKLGGTPGEKNSVYTSSPMFVDTEIEAQCIPSYFSDYTTLRFQGKQGTNFVVSVFDINGKVLTSHSGTFTNNGIHYLDLFAEPENYKSGLYIVNVQTGQKSKTIKVTKY